MNASLFHPYTYANVHPGFPIDCVVFCFANRKIKILLNKFTFGEHWQLPGGFMFKTEDSDQAAARILAERTETADVFLKQFHLFSAINRTNINENVTYINVRKKEYTDIDLEDTERWYLNRFVTLGYYAFIKKKIRLVKDHEFVWKWFDLNVLPFLYSDHRLIIKTTLENIRSKITLLPVAQNLLSEKFTMSEFRKIYEIILKKNVQKKFTA